MDRWSGERQVNVKSQSELDIGERETCSVPIVLKIYSEERKGAKPAKICTFFTLRKIKMAFSQKFSKV